MDGWLADWMDGWLADWMDGWMGGWMCKFILARDFMNLQF
jgi:hypothetical protein